MNYIAFDQIRQSGKADMRVRPDIHPVAGAKRCRTQRVEEGPDHAALFGREGAPHFEAVAEIAEPR
jgi:hypothetical protein